MLETICETMVSAYQRNWITSRENNRALEYTSLCKECYDWHEHEGLVLHDEGEENKWINGK